MLTTVFANIKCPIDWVAVTGLVKLQLLISQQFRTIRVHCGPLNLTFNEGTVMVGGKTLEHRLLSFLFADLPWRQSQTLDATLPELFAQDEDADEAEEEDEDDDDDDLDDDEEDFDDEEFEDDDFDEEDLDDEEFDEEDFDDDDFDDDDFDDDDDDDDDDDEDEEDLDDEP